MPPAEVLNQLEAREGSFLELTALKLRQILRTHCKAPIPVDFLNASIKTLTGLLDDDRAANPRGRSPDPGLRAEARETMRLIGNQPQIVGVLDPERTQRAYDVLKTDVVNLEGIDARLVPYVTHVMALFHEKRLERTRIDSEAGRNVPPSHSVPSTDRASSEQISLPKFEDMGILALARSLPLGAPEFDEFAIVLMRSLIRSGDGELELPYVASTSAEALLTMVDKYGVEEVKGVKRLTGQGYEGVETLRRLALSCGWRLVEPDIKTRLFNYFAALSGEINTGLGPYLEHITILFHPRD
ncbi:MAG: hypothetical protein DCC75_03935 [Proteobacteria bacterium]|nr:MAG: hypothetical protein DCC75_03935 [Pseudomonadota bacterium]